MIPPAEVTYTMLLGRVLQHYREQRGMPQQQVAVALGILQPAYSRIEKGDTTVTITQLRMLARAFGLANPSPLLDDAERWADELRRQGVTITDEKAVPKAALLVGLGILAATVFVMSNSQKG